MMIILLFDQVVNGIQEEWEVELEKLTAKFERELSKKKGSREDYKILTVKHHKEKEEFEKNMTIKREKKKEHIAKKLLEQERWGLLRYCFLNCNVGRFSML